MDLLYHIPLFQFMGLFGFIRAHDMRNINMCNHFIFVRFAKTFKGRKEKNRIHHKPFAPSRFAFFSS